MNWKVAPYLCSKHKCSEKVVNGPKNQQNIGEANGMPELPSVAAQATKTGNVGSVDSFSAAHLFTFGPRGQGNALRGSLMVSKNRGSQWYAQSAQCTNIGYVKIKRGCLGRSKYLHLDLRGSVMTA